MSVRFRSMASRGLREHPQRRSVRQTRRGKRMCKSNRQNSDTHWDRDLQRALWLHQSWTSSCSQLLRVSNADSSFLLRGGQFFSPFLPFTNMMSSRMQGSTGEDYDDVLLRNQISECSVSHGKTVARHEKRTLTFVWPQSRHLHTLAFGRLSVVRGSSSSNSEEISQLRSSSLSTSAQSLVGVLGASDPVSGCSGRPAPRCVNHHKKPSRFRD